MPVMNKSCRRTCAAIVCTYNAPGWLALILTALARQSQLPDEILIADDGSDDRSAAVVRCCRQHLGLPIRHLWHPDRGFRKGIIVNRAVALSAADDLLFLDGDVIPHRHWLRDHARLADGRTVWCGRRVRLEQDLSRRLGPADIVAGRLDRLTSDLLLPGIVQQQVRHWGKALPLPWSWARMIHQSRRKGLMGCNFSLPRRAFVALNGYNEEWQRRLDWNLEHRLRRAGWRLRPALNAAVVFHLHHREYPDSRSYPDHGPIVAPRDLILPDPEVELR